MKRQLFQELLESHRDRIYSQALYSLRNAHDAEDVTQEAFLKLWDRYEDIDPAKVTGWLRRVTHNLCVDQARRRQAQTSHFGRPDHEAISALVASGDSGSDPEHGLLLEERQQVLLDALATLPAETRSVMLMHYFQEMRLQDIGAELGKSVSALKVQIHRARRSLRLVLSAVPVETPHAKREIG